MIDVILSLGSNLGDRAQNMRRMEQKIADFLLPPINRSSLMETEPLGTASDQQWFYNRIVRGGFSGTPRELLQACVAIEKKLGRTRPYRYAARTADIDILLFGELMVNEPDLVVPHPAIQKRRFCIMGLREIAPEMVFPGGVKRIDDVAREWEAEASKQKVRIIETRYDKDA